MDEWMIPVLVAGVVLLLALGLLVAGAAVFGALFMRRRRGPLALGRSDGMAGLGYAEVEAGRWSRTVQGAQMVFDDNQHGMTWSIRLPRYNTMTLKLSEVGRSGPIEGSFRSGHPDLDQRFSMGSPQPARVSALLQNPRVRRALLAMPNVALSLSADELTIEDPERAGLAQLDGTVDAELQLHTLADGLVEALFSALYTETGTLFDVHR